MPVHERCCPGGQPVMTQLAPIAQRTVHCALSAHATTQLVPGSQVTSQVELLAHVTLHDDRLSHVKRADELFWMR